MPRARFGRDRSLRLWRLSLGVSLLLHAALLWLPAGTPPAPSASRPQPALMLTLQSPLPAAASSLTPSSSALAAVRGEARGEVRRSRAVPRAGHATPSVALPARSSLPSPSSASASAPVDFAPPQLDVDGMRAQARELAHGDRPQSPVATSDAPDGARLEALARRIGQPLTAASERRLADGSRMIRFAGNVCLHIPRHLPLGFENAFGPTVLVPTNCRD